jgi:hypothetical protein
MSYLVLRGGWLNIVVLNVQVRRKVMNRKTVLRGIRAGFLLFSEAPYEYYVRKS